MVNKLISKCSETSTNPLKKYQKKNLAAAIVVPALFCSACGLMESVEVAELQDNGTDVEFTKTLRMANVYEPNHAANRCGTATMKKELAKVGIELKVYPGSQLGNEMETVEQVVTGALDIGMSTGAFFANWYPEAVVVDVPFFVEDAETYDKVMRGKTMTQFYEEMADETGLEVYSSWLYGTRHITSNKPIRNPEDLRGVKIRTPDAPMYLQMMEAFGGTATPMALTEVYLGLQQGTIDAQENPIPTIYSNKFNEVQSTLNLTGHVIQGVQVFTSSDLLESLTEDEASALKAATDKARVANFECIKSGEVEILETWKKDGSIEIVDDVDQSKFQSAIEQRLLPDQEWASIYERVQDEIDSGITTVVGEDIKSSLLGEQIEG
ncbi:DctP family TRAP transporter solute-binding subunit [Corynebacterium sp. MNWGS58]|uniref:DctP family TRAP transporter solute-binding subunit n=1 Tax=Corynebacterium sp. 102791.4 TaxID=3104612 RepID=UPI0035122377